MNVPTNHLVIIISKYALHETLLNCALTLKRRRIKTIAITNHQEILYLKDVIMSFPSLFIQIKIVLMSYNFI